MVREGSARCLVKSRVSAIGGAPAAGHAVSTLGEVDRASILGRQSRADVRDGGGDKALRRFHERARGLCDSQQAGIGRIHVHNRASGWSGVRHEVEAVVCVEAQVRDQKIRHRFPDVLTGRDEITAGGDLRNGRQNALQSHPAADVGFDD